MEFEEDRDWLPAMELDCPPDKPAICSTYPEYMLEIQGNREECYLQPRSVPLMKEENVAVKRLTESMWIDWKRTPVEYFECLSPDAFDVDRTPCAVEKQPGVWQVNLKDVRGAALTFELKDQVVGWPYFTIEAPEGTSVELMVHEAHEPGGPALLNSHYHSWSRFWIRH